jgi:hypothetical protein
VGLTLAGPNLVIQEPRSDPAQRWRLLRTLSEAETGNRSLAQLLSLGRPARTASLVVITPSSDPAWLATAENMHRDGRLTALLVDPLEFGGNSDQARVASALTHRGIPHTRMPRTLLEEAYSSLRRIGRESGKRYLEKRGAAWQSMD